MDWVLARDPGLCDVATRGSTIARPSSAHAVHATAVGLEPDRWYWYQFRTGPLRSRVGRTRTLPDPLSPASHLRFAFVSCQNFEQGYYTAFAHLARENVDFVVHLGDAIYEGPATPGALREHTGGEPFTLADYRTRHAQYRSDPDLQDAYAQFPFVCAWDDHEVENNYAGTTSEDEDIPERARRASREFASRRAAAYRAYFEHMPLCASARPGPGGAQLFRGFRFGQLAEFSVLDTRQYRSNQPCGGDADEISPQGDDIVLGCGEEHRPGASMLGAEQEAWLRARLEDSRAHWQVLAQQVLMAQVNLTPGSPAAVLNTDGWDGYTAARRRLLGHIAERRIRNVVALTGDIHSSWIADLRPDFDDPRSPVVATELVGTSITSAFPLGLVPLVERAIAHPRNAHIRFFEARRRGYVVCDVTPERWRAEIRAVSTVLEPTADLETLAAFEIRSGIPGARRVGPPGALPGELTRATPKPARAEL